MVSVGQLETLYSERLDHLVGLADWLIGDRAIAEEVVQDTFIRLVADPPNLRNRAALDAYVRTSVLNRCRSRARRLSLERRYSRSLSEPIAEDRYLDNQVRQAVLSLPMRQRQCVVLRFYDDLTVAQIAKTLRLRPGTVKSHLHRGLQTLGEQLNEEVRS